MGLLDILNTIQAGGVSNDPRARMTVARRVTHERTVMIEKDPLLKLMRS